MSTIDTIEGHLIRGWEPDLSVEDTWLRRAIFAIGDEMESHISAIGGRPIRRHDMLGGILDRPATFLNGVVLSQPIPHEDVDATMASWYQEFEFESDATGTIFVFSPWPTPDLTRWGWSLAGYPPLMFRPTGGSGPDHDPHITTEIVTTPEHLLAWEKVAINGFPLEDLKPATPWTLVSEELLHHENTTMWIAKLDGEVVGAASSTICHGMNYVGFVAILDSARGNGIGKHLTWLASTLDPGLPALLVTSSEGRPLYERLGYLPLQRFTLWYRDRGTP